MMTADAERRGLSLERTLMTFEIVGRFHFGVSIWNVRDAIMDEQGIAWCPRTIRRDLVLLERMGWIERKKFRLAERKETRWCMARARPILFAMRRLVGTA